MFSVFYLLFSWIVFLGVGDQCESEVVVGNVFGSVLMGNGWICTAFLFFGVGFMKWGSGI